MGTTTPHAAPHGSSTASPPPQAARLRFLLSRGIKRHREHRNRNDDGLKPSAAQAKSEYRDARATHHPHIVRKVMTHMGLPYAEATPKDASAHSF